MSMDAIGLPVLTAWCWKGCTRSVVRALLHRRVVRQGPLSWVRSLNYPLSSARLSGRKQSGLIP